MRRRNPGSDRAYITPEYRFMFKMQTPTTTVCYRTAAERIRPPILSILSSDDEDVVTISSPPPAIIDLTESDRDTIPCETEIETENKAENETYNEAENTKEENAMEKNVIEKKASENKAKN